jgi:hypothetical protein
MLDVIMDPTIIKAGPVDQGGKLAKIGEKKMVTKNPKAIVYTEQKRRIVSHLLHVA